MGVKNYLIEGVSCAGKSTVGRALERLGHQVIHGDDELAYQGDPVTGEPTDGFAHGNHIWDVEKIQAVAADEAHALTFFCGGSRNHDRFAHLLDGVFLLEIDLETLKARLDARPADEWGGEPTPWEVMVRLHATKEDQPKDGAIIDATQPVESVAEAILEHVG